MLKTGAPVSTFQCLLICTQRYEGALMSQRTRHQYACSKCLLLAMARLPIVHFHTQIRERPTIHIEIFSDVCASLGVEHLNTPAYHLRLINRAELSIGLMFPGRRTVFHNADQIGLLCSVFDVSV